MRNIEERKTAQESFNIWPYKPFFVSLHALSLARHGEERTPEEENFIFQIYSVG